MLPLVNDTFWKFWLWEIIFIGGGAILWGNFHWSMWVPESSHLGLLYGVADGHRSETIIQLQRKEILHWPFRDYEQNKTSYI